MTRWLGDAWSEVNARVGSVFVESTRFLVDLRGILKERANLNQRLAEIRRGPGRWNR